MASRTPSTKGYRLAFRDAWVLCKGDSASAPDLVRQFKRDWPGSVVRTMKRKLSVLGGTVPVTIVAVREKVAGCTCRRREWSHESGGYVLARANWLLRDCDYCLLGAEHLTLTPAERRTVLASTPPRTTVPDRIRA